MTEPAKTTDLELPGNPNKAATRETMRTEPEWDTDFGPDTSRPKRILWAVLCCTLIIAFLVAAVGLGKPSKPLDPATTSGIPVWIFFVAYSILALVISLTGEKIALRIQAKLGWNKGDEL